MSNLRRGWYWGRQAFAERLLEMAGAAVSRARGRSSRSSLESKAHDQRTAELLVKAGLKRAGLFMAMRLLFGGRRGWLVGHGE